MGKERKLFFLIGGTALALSCLIALTKPVELESGVLASDSNTTNYSDLEDKMLQRVNLARAEIGLGALTFDPELGKVARIRSLESATNFPLTHFNRDGTLEFADLLGKFQYPYALAGENLARCSPPTQTAVDRCFEALMNSPLHRSNILEPIFTRVAIGLTTDSNGLEVFAQIFAQSPEEFE